jgi:hypothetical protein
MLWSQPGDCKMFKHMLLALGAAWLLVAVTAMPVQAIPLPGPIPLNLIITGDNGKWEWVWVSPCDEEGGKKCSFGPNVDLYDFAAPVITTTSNPWTDSFTGYSDMLDTFRNPAFDVGLPQTLLNYPTLCATPYFSQDYNTCNGGDLLQGAVRGAPFLPPGTDLRNDPSAEVFWVREKVSVPDPNTVPEPSSLLLLGAGLLGLAAWRWKHTA